MWTRTHGLGLRYKTKWSGVDVSNLVGPHSSNFSIETTLKDLFLHFATMVTNVQNSVETQ